MELHAVEDMGDHYHVMFKDQPGRRVDLFADVLILKERDGDRIRRRAISWDLIFDVAMFGDWEVSRATNETEHPNP